MAKKGIKVKELARELGVTSRELIDRCRSGGLVVQNSITRVDRDAERTIRGWFDADHGQAPPESNESPRATLAD